MNEPHGPACTNPDLSQFLTSYCAGESSFEEQEALEAHLFECDACWAEFQRLDGAVRALRFDLRVRPILPVAQIASLFGMSGSVSRVFAGHAAYVLTVASLYGLEWTASVWSELGYSYNRFAALAWVLSPVVLVWMSVSVSLALWIDARRTVAGRSDGFKWSAAIVLSAAGILLGFLMIVLPKEPTIVASFQTRSGASGYLKNILFYFLPLLVFVVPTFHTVVQLQHDLSSGRHAMVSNFLKRKPESVGPRGLTYIAPWFLLASVLAAAVIAIQGTNHMLDVLKPGPYADLYRFAEYARVGLWFAVAVLSLWWYSNALTELKREVLAVNACTAGNQERH